MKKYLVIILMFYTGLLFASEFDEAFGLSARGFDKQANKVSEYFNSNIEYDLNYQRQDLELIAASLKELEKKYNNNPVFWFVSGLHARNMAGFNEQLGNDAEVRRWLDFKTKRFIKAMSLDKNNQPHLSASAYAAMKSGLPPPHKQYAIEKELDLGGDGENDSYYWYLHWSNINELQKQKKFTEADDALLRMKKELAESDQGNTFEGLVKTIDAELEAVKMAAQSKEKTRPLPPERDHQAFTEEHAEDKYYFYLTVVGLIMGAIIFLLLLFELKRRKNK